MEVWGVEKPSILSSLLIVFDVSELLIILRLRLLFGMK
jgi:hypothetical protein